MLKRPSYLMIPVTVTTHWYDNYGLAVLKQLQDLMRSRWLGGLLMSSYSYRYHEIGWTFQHWQESKASMAINTFSEETGDPCKEVLCPESESPKLRE